ncbi:MAG: preprotein translocase subunit YajC [Spirosomaceae bacterium]|jgi:preprotein translocase subunit YajC|nr:preprotein translocase subunit YajC [Spirosomataceae bacterium]
MILLQAAAGGGMFQILFLVGMIAIFYFFMIRPQQKKQNDQKKMIDELKDGDEVVTIGGLHGKVLSKDENTVTLSAGGGARLTFEKSSIARKK